VRVVYKQCRGFAGETETTLERVLYRCEEVGTERVVKEGVT
jgi:hypothetical protein